MDLTQILAWIVGANTVINFATTTYTLMSARATKALEAIGGLGKKIEQLAKERQEAGDAVAHVLELTDPQDLRAGGEHEQGHSDHGGEAAANRDGYRSRTRRGRTRLR